MNGGNYINNPSGEFSFGGEPAVPPRGNGPKTALGIVVGIIILAVIGMGVVIATNVWNPFKHISEGHQGEITTSPISKKELVNLDPEGIIEMMLKKMDDLKTYHSEMSLGLKGSDNSGNFVQHTVNIIGDSDTTDSKSPKKAVDFNLNLQIKTKLENANFNLNFVLADRVKKIGNDFYLKIDKAVVPSQMDCNKEGEQLLEWFGLLMLKNRWFKVDKNQLEWAANKVVGKKIKEIELSEEKEEEIEKQIKDLLKEKENYEIKEMPVEKINKKEAYHYILSLNNKGIEKAILLFDVIKGNNLESAALANCVEQEEFNEVVDKIFKEGNKLNIEIWVGKEDYLLYRVKFEKKMLAGSISDEGADDGKIAINFDLRMSKFNKPVKIEVPENLSDLRSIVYGIENERKQRESRTRDYIIKSDLSELRMTAELYSMNHNNFYSGFCNSADAGRLKSEINKNGKIVVCNDSKYEWAACSPLYNTEEKNFCVDSTGVAKVEPNMICTPNWFKFTACP